MVMIASNYNHSQDSEMTLYFMIIYLQIEIAYLQMSKHKICYVVCGMFEINHGLNFLYMAFSMSSVIILIQAEYIYGDITLDV